jgi:putative ABC transport system permease protein
MRSIFFVIKSNYKKQKIQHLLIAISLALATLLAGVSGGILKSLHQPFDLIFNKLNASHLLLFFDNRSYDTPFMRDWFIRQPEVSRVGDASPYILHNGPLIHRNQKIDVMVQITERTNDNNFQDMLMQSDSILHSQPGYGEIWIPNYLSVNYHIEIGDSIGISVPSGFYNFKVSAVVVDPHYSSGMINPTRAWIAPGELSMLYPETMLTQVMLSVRLKDAGTSGQLWLRFSKQFRYTGTMLQYSLFKGAFTSMFQIISAILILFSLLAFLVALFLIGSTIKGAIHSDYRTIGIYKVLGFEPSRLISLLMVQFGVNTVLIIPLALSGSYYLLKVVMVMLTRSLGIIQINYHMFFPFMIMGLTIFLIIMLVCWLESRRASKVNVVEAIRYGLPMSSVNINKNTFDFSNSGLPVSGLLGIKLLLFNKRRSLVTFISLLFTVFILIFSVNIANSFSGLKNNKPAWGFDNGDIQLSRSSQVALSLTHEQFQEMMANEKDVKYCIPYSYHSLIFLTHDNEPKQEIYGRAYFGSFSDAGLENIAGNHPSKKNEISLCIGTMQMLQKQPGDSVYAFFEGQSRYFIITGVYQDVSNMGQGFRLTGATILDSNPIFKPAAYSVILKNSSLANIFKDHLQSEYGESIHVDLSIDERIALMGIITNMQVGLAFLSLIFLVVLLVSIWNDNLSNVRDQQKNFGILKVTGFTSTQLKKGLIFRNMIIAVPAIIIGLPLAIWGSPLLMSIFTAGIGLKRFPFLITIIGSVLVLIVILLFSLLSTWISSRSLGKLQPRVLIRE